MSKIIILENNQKWKDKVSEALSPSHTVNCFSNGKDLHEKLTSEHYQAVILDLQVQNKETFDLLKWIKSTISYIPETLLESELFGHEKGSFTGANKLRVGRF